MVESHLKSASNFVWQYSGLNHITGLFKGNNTHHLCKEQLLTNQPVKATLRNVAMQACGRGFVRLAGVSGALAVGFGAYGAHGNNFKQYFIHFILFHSPFLCMSLLSLLP